MSELPATDDGDMVKMAVNADTCISGGQCEMLESDVFLVDDDLAIATVIGDGLLTRKRAEEVIDRCPAAAISIVVNDAGANDAGANGAVDTETPDD